MTAMYIANCTNQNIDFQYRLPENPKVIKQTIPIGQQIRIPGDLSTPDVEAVIRQHAKYGLVAVSEIDRSRNFIGVCYQLDKPIQVDKLAKAIDHNYKVLDAIGKTIREEAAVVIENTIADSIPQRLGRLNELEIEIEERPSRVNPTQEEIHEVTLVSRTLEPRRGKPAGDAIKSHRRRAA